MTTTPSPANATTMIIAACDAMFQQGWEAQVEYLRTQYAQFEKAVVLAEESKAKHPLFAIRQIDATTFFYRAVYNVETGNPYTALKATARANFDELCRAMTGIAKKGFDAYVAAERAAYIADLTAYLRLSLEKKGVEAYAEATGILVNGSPKGYKITANVDGRCINTDCIPVGGYNIVRFHYRYTVTVAAPASLPTGYTLGEIMEPTSAAVAEIIRRANQSA